MYLGLFYFIILLKINSKHHKLPISAPPTPAPALWSPPIPLAPSLLPTLLKVWPLGPPQWLASPQLHDTIAAADMAIAQTVALLLAARQNPPPKPASLQGM